SRGTGRPRHDDAPGRGRGTPEGSRSATRWHSGAMTETPRNPHAGQPFTDDDAAIAAALEDVAVPALLCSLVHMTGDPSWIRGDIWPRADSLIDFQGGLTGAELAEVRAKALPAIAAYRDAGCV